MLYYNYVADIPGRQTLLLVVLPVSLTNVPNRTFSVVVPQTWSDLPDDMTSAELFIVVHLASASRNLSFHGTIF